ALERLAAPEQSSRTPDFEGRRLVRINGGYLVLNFIKYRDRDHTTAIRSKRYRERKKNNRHGVTSSSHGVSSRDITQAEAYAEAEHPLPPSRGPRLRRGARREAKLDAATAAMREQNKIFKGEA